MLESMTQTVQFANSSSDPADNNHDIVSGNRRSCFYIPILTNLSSLPSSSEASTWWDRIRRTDKTYASAEGPRWARGWHRFCEWSEHTARSRWKAFMRKFSRSRMMMHRSSLQFLYDPLSYALNFDEGPGQNGDFDRDTLTRDFSIRYASIPSTCKSSMDLGHSGPLFT